MLSFCAINDTEVLLNWNSSNMAMSCGVTTAYIDVPGLVLIRYLEDCWHRAQ